MVGVPGRAKGCSTCRRRKKKCDMQTPTCGNCAKGNYTCGGYVREMLIVHVNNAGKGTYKPPKQAPKPTRLAENSFGYYCSTADVRVRDLNRAALESRSVDAFWDFYLPRPQKINNGGYFPFTSGAINRNWAFYTTHYLPQSPIVRCALLALSTAQLGKYHRDVNLVQRGFELYGLALSRVSSALKATNGPSNFGVLNSCRLLALFEQHYDIDGQSTVSNWRSHIKGLTHLIQHHPAETFCLPGKHEVFLEARLEGILIALCDRKATFLASPGWMSIPWTGRSKSASDTALDIMAKIPGIWEEFESNNPQIRVSNTNERGCRLKECMWELETELKLWYEEFVYLYGCSFADPEGLELLEASTGDPAQQVSLPEVLSRQGVAPLFAMTIYWTCCTVISILQANKHFPSNTLAELKPSKRCRFELSKCCICLGRSIMLLSEPGAGLASFSSFAGMATACVISGYVAIKSNSESDDVLLIERYLRKLMTKGNSMWSQTWAVAMNRLE